MAQNIGGTFTLEHHVLDNGGISILKLLKATRFYVSTDGGTLIKRSDLLKGGDNSTSVLVQGKKCNILNNCKDDNAHHHNIDYSYYTKQANKWVNVIQYGLNTKRKKGGSYVPFSTGGLTLFD